MLVTFRKYCSHILESHPGKAALLSLAITGIWISLCYCIFNGPGSFLSPQQIGGEEALFIAKIVFIALGFCHFIDFIYYARIFYKNQLQSSLNIKPLSTKILRSISVQDARLIPYFTTGKQQLTEENARSKAIKKGSLRQCADFLLLCKYSSHLFTIRGHHIQSKKSMKKLDYVVTSFFDLKVAKNCFFTNFNVMGSNAQAISFVFFQFMKEAKLDKKIYWPKALIIPFCVESNDVRLGHCILIVIERDDEETFHLSCIDSLGPHGARQGNEYDQKDIRLGVEDALRQICRSQIRIIRHYGPNQNNQNLCGIHIQMNIEAAIKCISQNRKVYESLDMFFPIRRQSTLLNQFDSDRKIAMHTQISSTEISTTVPKSLA